jgi:hypothetical protein
MPNWVYNGLTIEGNPDEVKSLINQMNKPFVNPVESNGDLSFNVKQVKYVNPVFAFRNIYSYKDAGVSDEVYMGQPPSTPDFSDWMKFQTNDWYNFNNREWGTKWDVAVADGEKYAETSIQETENGENYVVYYSFNTAWSVPIPAIKKLSAQYPNLLMTLSYEEETGWGGEMEFLRGEVISESEYGWQCKDCDHTEDETPYCEECEYDMCPACGWGEPDEACKVHTKKVDA